MCLSVLEAVFKHATDCPHKLCLVDDRRSISYSEYLDQILKGASYLLKLGVRSGDLVMVESSQTIDYLALQLSIQSLGAIFVPISSNLSIEKIESIIFKVKPNYVFTNSTKKDLSFRNVIELQQFTAQLPYYEVFHLTSFPKKNDVSEILFTTGTTGSEKGIVISFENNIAIAENVIAGTGMKDDNVELILSPFNHSHGLRRYYANMYKGASVVMQSSLVFVKNLFYKMDKYKVNSIDMVPSTLSVLLKMSGESVLSKYRDSLRYVQFGAAPITDADKQLLRHLWPRTKLLNMYGSTESGVSCVSDFSIDNKKNSIGRPAINSTIFVVDEKHRKITSSKNNTGFLACKSRANMLGYYAVKEEISKDVLSDGVVYTNDVVFIDNDGDIILLGRKGDVINVGGSKFSPIEVEECALAFPQLEDCACVAVQDNSKVNVPKLFIQLKESVDKTQFDVLKLKKFLSEKLEHYKVPCSYEVIDKIPRTYKGSIQRNLLKG